MIEAPYRPKGGPLELLILSGLQGSGKTSHALDWVARNPAYRERINYDDLRVELFGPDWKFNKVQENEMKAVADTRAAMALMHGKSVVVDNTNLTPRSKKHWEQLGRKYKAQVSLEILSTPVQECKNRDQRRVGKARVGWAVIDRTALFNGLIDWNDTSVYRPEPFIVVDMDGTLADCEWRRHYIRPDYCLTCKKVVGRLNLLNGTKGNCTACNGPVRDGKDWKNFFSHVGEDPPNIPILNLVKHLCYFGYQLLIVSGRPIDQCGMATEMWLREHISSVGIVVQHLFMRDTKDGRSDVEVKAKIRDLLPLDRIAYVIDDRASVCNEVWRKAGLCTLQVDEGAF